MKKRYLFADIAGGILSMLATPIIFWGRVLIMKIIYVFVGIIFGWIIGWFFGETILGIFAEIGIIGFSMWQIGAFLGFVGSFFGSNNYYHPQKKDEPQNMNYSTHQGLRY